MLALQKDELWEYFKPLWNDLLQVTPAPGFLLAGGYGLFLKQKWLQMNRDKASIAAIDRWKDPTPRVTRDYDIIHELSLIHSDDNQRRMHEILEKYGFNPVARKEQWQFAKGGEKVLAKIDFHCPLSSKETETSQGRLYVRGLGDPETAGFDQHPFYFQYDGVNIAVPNPVTWAVMKLTAMFDHQGKSHTKRDAKFYEDQAKKHAQDVCRVIAMTTRDERDSAESVASAIQEADAFKRAVTIQNDFFQKEDGWGRLVIQTQWLEDDLRAILDTLSSWFRQK
ncbi:MAG: hypothetical protein NTX50_05205 [Candidatus Sumerlaeota bacterium]|nr:hypothetical protein [Candidatus Sumerlaeota bacterium]